MKQSDAEEPYTIAIIAVLLRQGNVFDEISLFHPKIRPLGELYLTLT